jgi:ankyrin repeat protein
MQAIAIGMFEAVEPLLDRGADPNFMNAQRRCPLWLAIKSDRPDIVQLLINKGAKVDFRGPSGTNAVHIACQTGDLELVRMVVAAGADPTAKDDRNRLPTFNVLMAGPAKMIPILAYLIDERKLDVNAKDDQGNTLLLELTSDSERMTPQIAQFLLSRNADMNVVAPNKKRTYELVMQCCRSEVKAVFTQWANKKRARP